MPEMNYSHQFLKETIELWQPHSPEPLTLEDAREIADNMTALYAYLHELKQKYDPKEADVQP